MPAGSFWPWTWTSCVTVKVVFSLAPARHGQLAQPLKPRSDIPYGTRSPQILPRRSFGATRMTSPSKIFPRTTRGLE